MIHQKNTAQYKNIKKDILNIDVLLLFRQLVHKNQNYSNTEKN